jgi:hypothetical protein
VESWARRQPALSSIFRGYRQVEKIAEVGIWLRNQTQYSSTYRAEISSNSPQQR